jgi:hypothetical protein
LIHAGFTHAALSLQYAKKRQRVSVAHLRFAYWFSDALKFRPFYPTDCKKNIPQNVVSTHTDRIPHIEKFLGKLVRQTIYDFCSACGKNRHGIVIATSGSRSTEAREHPQGY